MRGWAIADQADMKEGLAPMHQGVIDWNATGGLTNQMTNLTYFNARLAEMYGKKGAHAKGLDIVNDALNFMAKSDERFCEAELYQIKGDLLLKHNNNNEKQAESYFQKALEVARHQETISLESKAAMSMSHLWQSQGNVDEAHTCCLGYTTGSPRALIQQIYKMPKHWSKRCHNTNCLGK